MRKINISWMDYLIIINLLILTGISIIYFYGTKSLWEPTKPLLISLQLPEIYSKFEKNSDDEMNYVDLSLKNPIFYINRKMPLPPPMKEVDDLPKDQWQEAQLLGIYRGSVSGAILLYGGIEKRLSIEEQLDGWILKKLYSDHIEIEQKGNLRKIELKKADLEKK